jgi:hypothetical protein
MPERDNLHCSEPMRVKRWFGPNQSLCLDYSRNLLLLHELLLPLQVQYSTVEVGWMYEYSFS